MIIIDRKKSNFTISCSISKSLSTLTNNESLNNICWVVGRVFVGAEMCSGDLFRHICPVRGMSTMSLYHSRRKVSWTQWLCCMHSGDISFMTGKDRPAVWWLVIHASAHCLSRDPSQVLRTVGFLLRYPCFVLLGSIWSSRCYNLRFQILHWPLSDSDIIGLGAVKVSWIRRYFGHDPRCKLSGRPWPLTQGDYW